jgi:hypothetical protein
MGAVAVAVALLLSLGAHELAVDAVRMEQLMEALELLIPVRIHLKCLVDSIDAALFGTATATGMALPLLE